MDAVAFTFLVKIIINGLIASAIYILIALGFNMIFGIMRIVNFAHGEFYMLGAFIVFQATHLMKLNYLLALLLALIVTGTLGMLIEKILFKRARKGEISDFVVSIALALILQSVALMVWGPDDQAILSVYPQIITIGSISLPVERLFVTIVTILLLSLFYLFVKFTKLGLSLRAVTQDSEVAALQGVKVERIYTISFGIGCSLAAIAGGLISPLFSISPYMGGHALLKAFVIVVLGGLGSVPGSLLGGLILGLVESFSSTYLGGRFSDIVGFVGILIILLLRPTGLLGSK